PAVFREFPIVTGPLAGKASMAIWTTTPWTLPANLAIAVDPDELYVVQEFCRGQVSNLPPSQGRDLESCATLVLADKMVPQFSANTQLEPTGEPLQSFRGRELDGIKARHP